MKKGKKKNKNINWNGPFSIIIIVEISFSINCEMMFNFPFICVLTWTKKGNHYYHRSFVFCHSMPGLYYPGNEPKKIHWICKWNCRLNWTFEHQCNISNEWFVMVHLFIIWVLVTDMAYTRLINIFHPFLYAYWCHFRFKFKSPEKEEMICKWRLIVGSECNQATTVWLLLCILLLLCIGGNKKGYSKNRISCQIVL